MDNTVLEPLCHSHLLNAESISLNRLRRHAEFRTTIPMSDHTDQQLSARDMVRAHAYPVLAALSSLSLVCIAVLLVPQAVKTHRYNRCVDAQSAMRVAINPKGLTTPGRMNYLKAVEHCEGS